MPIWSRPPAQTQSKTVRFAYKNLFYSPRIPVSVAPSLATPPTGYGLPGPSPYALPCSPYALPCSPQNTTTSVQYTGPIRAHPLLDASAVAYDLMEHPSTITSPNNHTLSPRTLREQATVPPLPFLTISSIHLPWIIKVYPSHGLYVTIDDVFDSIYRTLRTNITNVEFNMFSSQNDRRRATRAYEKRYRRLRNKEAYKDEKRGGMKRVDFLMGHTKFIGISNTSHRSDEWELRIA